MYMYMAALHVVPPVLNIPPMCLMDSRGKERYPASLFPCGCRLHNRDKSQLRYQGFRWIKETLSVLTRPVEGEVFELGMMDNQGGMGGSR
jgi:hypothetical protein